MERTRKGTGLRLQQLLENLYLEYSDVAEISPAAFEEKLLAGIAVWADLNLGEARGIIDNICGVGGGNGGGPPSLIKTDNLQSIVDSLCSLTMEDALTGLFNRRYFDHRLVQELQRGARDQVSCSLIMVDIDHFKKVNDKYGHDVGDQTLRHVATLLRDALRTTDTTTRLGGEEFALILPRSDLREAMAVAERLRKGIEDAPLEVGDQKVSCTISAGVSTVLVGQIQTAEALIQQADEALYKAKEGGRNQISGYGPLPTPIPDTGVSKDERDLLFR